MGTSINAGVDTGVVPGTLSIMGEMRKITVEVEALREDG